METSHEKLSKNNPVVFVALGVALSLFGGWPLLAALGFIQLDSSEGVGTRILLFLIGAPLSLMGGGVLYQGVKRMVDASVPGSSPLLCRLGIHLGRRVTLRTTLVALPSAAIATEYWLAGVYEHPPFGIERDVLEELMVVEFVTLHATVFLGAVLLAPIDPKRRVLQCAAFVLLLSVYGVIAASELHWQTALVWVYLMTNRLGRFVFRRPRVSTLVSLASRWGVEFALFILTAGLVGGAIGSSRATDWGVWYFGSIAVLETFGLLGIRTADPGEKPRGSPDARVLAGASATIPPCGPTRRRPPSSSAGRRGATATR